MLRDAFVTGVIFWVVYMAAEPVVRRRSPATLIAWNRLLEGKLRDPRIGGEVLAGLVLGVVGTFVVDLVPIPFIEPLAPRLAPDLAAFLSLWCWFTIGLYWVKQCICSECAVAARPESVAGGVDLCHFDDHSVYRGWSADHRIARASSPADSGVHAHEIRGAR